MRHRIFKQMAALTLGLIMLSSQCACAMTPQEMFDMLKPQQTDSTKETADAQAHPQDAAPADKNTALDESVPTASMYIPPASANPPQSTVSAAGQQSLLSLRDRMSFPQTMFGAAYLGYVDTPFEAGSSQWLQALNPAMVLKYPFMAEIDANHIIGNTGHLYCIVPLDPNASLAINRVCWSVRWNEQARREEITETVYRSESGEPVLLFANLDGVAYEDDTLIHVTDSQGNTCQWYPSFDAMSYLVPCTAESGANLCFVFTEYGWRSADPSLAPWLAGGYGGPKAIVLGGDPNASPAGEGWIIQTTANDPVPNTDFSLWLYSNSDTNGSFVLYADRKRADGQGFEQVGTWNGTWSIQTVMDGPSDVAFEMSLITSSPYDYPYDTTNAHLPREVHDIYPVLISPSGMELVIGPGVSGSRLPFMSWDGSPCTLMRVE